MTLLGFGVRPDRLDVLWEKAKTPSQLNPSGKCLIHLTQDLYKQHLLPGPTFSRLTSKFKTSLTYLTAWGKLSQDVGTVRNASINHISLYDLCAKVMIDSTQITLFDPILFKIDPHMTRSMRQFTDELWKLLYPSPFVDTREVVALRQQYHRAFMIYQRLPTELRKEEAWVVTALIDQYKKLGIHEDDSAAMLVMVYWTYVISLIC